MIRDIILMALVPLWVVTCAWIDAGHYRKKEWVYNHWSRLFNRGTVFLMLGVFNPLIGLYGLFVFWAMFDGILSTLREGNLGWYYIGSVAGTDKFFSKYPNLYIVSKHISWIVAFVLVSLIIKPYL